MPLMDEDILRFVQLLFARWVYMGLGEPVEVPELRDEEF
jgi:hypothetical protein